MPPVVVHHRPDQPDPPRRCDADPQLPVLDVDAELVPVDREHPTSSNTSRRTITPTRRWGSRSRGGPRSPLGSDRCTAPVGCPVGVDHVVPAVASPMPRVTRRSTRPGDARAWGTHTSSESQNAISSPDARRDAPVARRGDPRCPVAPAEPGRRRRAPTQPARSSLPPSSTSTTSSDRQLAGAAGRASRRASRAGIAASCDRG